MGGQGRSHREHEKAFKSQRVNTVYHAVNVGCPSHLSGDCTELDPLFSAKEEKKHLTVYN